MPHTLKSKDGIKRLFKKRVAELLKEYIDEAEHQDGRTYWRDFGSPDKAVEDFLIYAKITTEDRLSEAKKKGK